MSYQSQETSIDGGKPIELYKFTIGPASYRYTSGQQNEVADTNAGAEETYTPLEITRTEPEQTRELARTQLTVTMPRDAVIANAFVAFVPTTRVKLTIYRQHQGDGTNFIRYWSGRVNSVNFKDNGTAELVCNPTLMALKRQGLRRNFGGSCQHALYDGGCGVLRADYLTSATLSVNQSIVDGNGVLTATAIGLVPDVDWFVSGYAQRANGEIRFIVAEAGNTVTVLRPFTNLLAGEVVDLYAGCKRDIDTCFNKFNTAENPDAANFFGFHVNPKRNPFKTGLK